MQAVGIVGAIGEHLLGWQPSNKVASRRHVVFLSGTELKANRQS